MSQDIISLLNKTKIDQDIHDFFFCGFSNILKNCLIWLQTSNKPTRDFKKQPSIQTFAKIVEGLGISIDDLIK